MNPTLLESIATFLFFIAILHTFLVSKFEIIAHRQPHASIAKNVWHYLSEVEVVFGLWSLVLLSIMMFISGPTAMIQYLEGLNFTEAAFVFVIMCMAATRPIITLAERIIKTVARLLPLQEKMAFYVATMIFGPLLGSFITEPAAMTVTALVLFDVYFQTSVSLKFKYGTLALLLVNVSVGGTLTHFAAPPVLMVAGKWGWDTAFMLQHFGYKALLGIVASTLFYAYLFRSDLKGIVRVKEYPEGYFIPRWWKIIIQALLLLLVVATAHHPKVFIGIFCFFLGFVKITQRYQNDLKIRESFLVAFFLAGLVTLGSMQAWWLRPLLGQLGDTLLFVGATALTAVTDNAALTYLGSLVELTDKAKYALVAGAVSGGGLTVIANAPNPVAFGILKDTFGKESIMPLRLFFYALPPTLFCMLFLWLLPS